MTLHELLDEYNLTHDDVRWSLCVQLAESIRNTLDRGDVEALVRRLWSGEIGDALYTPEERWSADRADRLNRKLLDEGHLRDELESFTLDRLHRRGK